MPAPASAAQKIRANDASRLGVGPRRPRATLKSPEFCGVGREVSWRSRILFARAESAKIPQDTGKRWQSEVNSGKPEAPKIVAMTTKSVLLQ